jgi:hypothetical protein
MHGCGHVFELHYNAALLAQRQGDLQESLIQVLEGMAHVTGSAAVCQPAQHGCGLRPHIWAPWVT